VNNTLRDYGFDEAVAQAYSRARADTSAHEPNKSEVPARVLEERRNLYIVVREGPDGSILTEEAVVSGKFRKSAASASQLPAVGDWVLLLPNQNGAATIRAVLPRRGAFMRKAPGDTDHDLVDAQVVAANVDLALIVCAVGEDWNERRIERYATLAKASGARPLLAISKADLAPDGGELLGRARIAAPGITTILVCAPQGQGLPELAAEIPSGSSVVLVGSSGAGKSTLLNALAGQDLASTGEVREDDQRGRHTTTHRQLYRLSAGPAAGALIIDTPGMRELQLWADEDEVGGAFPEIEELARGCRFRDCRHELEPGCAVREALESGALDAGRYEGWRKLVKEASFLRTKEDHAAKESERRRWKSIEMSRRAYAKTQRRGGER